MHQEEEEGQKQVGHITQINPATVSTICITPFPRFHPLFLLFYFHPVRLQLTWVPAATLSFSLSLSHSLSLFHFYLASQFRIRDYQSSYFSTSCPVQTCFLFRQCHRSNLEPRALDNAFCPARYTHVSMKPLSADQRARFFFFLLSLFETC